MSYRESNYKDILISKILVGIWIIYLFSFVKKWGDKWFFAGGANNFIRTVGAFESSITFLIFIFQFFLIWRLLKPKKTKNRFTNFNIIFHPIFHNAYQKKLMFFFTLFVLFFLFFDFGTDEIKFHLNPAVHSIIFYIIKNHHSTLNSFPINFMKSNSLRLIVKYQDYINHKIADDEPHLTINQNFDVSLKSLPRNDSEKNLIEIKNPDTPINPALVYKIEDKDLADTLRNGYIIKAKLIAIKEEGNLEIELSLRKPFDFFIEDKIKKYAKNWAKFINETEANDKTTESSYFFYNEEIENLKKEGWVLSSDLEDEQKFNDVIWINGQDWFKIRSLN